MRNLARQVEKLYLGFDSWTWKEIASAQVRKLEKTLDDTLDFFSFKDAITYFQTEPSYFSENLQEIYDIYDLERANKFVSDLQGPGVFFGVC